MTVAHEVREPHLCAKLCSRKLAGFCTCVDAEKVEVEEEDNDDDDDETTRAILFPKHYNA